MTDQAQIELPKYNCHKQVWALKIKTINDVTENEDGIGASLVFEEKEYSPIDITDDFIAKNNPQAGGYYVVYKGGYTSYSPEDAFEEGYSRA